MTATDTIGRCRSARVVACERCGRPFMRTAAHPGQRFCSQPCAAKAGAAGRTPPPPSNPRGAYAVVYDLVNRWGDVLPQVEAQRPTLVEAVAIAEGMGPAYRAVRVEHWPRFGGERVAWTKVLVTEEVA